jgi:hypothetical protein
MYNPHWHVVENLEIVEPNDVINNFIENQSIQMLAIPNWKSVNSFTSYPTPDLTR